MEQNTINQEANFSFKKLTDLLKMSIKRVLIYALISGIIGASVAAIVIVTLKGDTEYKGTIEFNYKNIDNGMDPKDNVLDTNRIKSNTVVNNALDAIGITNEVEKAKLMPILVDDTMINGYVSDAMKKALITDSTLSYFPTRYDIIIKNNAKTGLSKNQYVTFLNKLMENYIIYFSDFYDFGKYVPVIINDSTAEKSNDYINAINVYKSEVLALQSEINDLPSTYASLKSKLQAHLNILVSEVNDIETYILINNVQKAGVSMTLAQFLGNEIDKYTEQESAYADEVVKLFDVIKEYKIAYKDITNTNSTLTVTVADMADYNKLVNDYKSACEREMYAKNKKNESERAEKIFEVAAAVAGTDIQREVLNAKFEQVYINYLAELNNINDELTNFAQLNVLSNGVKVAMVATKNANVPYMNAAVAFLVIFMLGVLAAIAVTYIKNTKELKKEQTTVIDE